MVCKDVYEEAAEASQNQKNDEAEVAFHNYNLDSAYVHHSYHTFHLRPNELFVFLRVKLFLSNLKIQQRCQSEVI